MTRIAEQPPTFIGTRAQEGMPPERSADAHIRARTSSARPRVGHSNSHPDGPASALHLPAHERANACAALDAMWAARPLEPPSRRPLQTQRATAGERALLRDIRIGAWEP